MQTNKPINFGPKQLWIEIFAAGPISHPTGDIEIDEDFRHNLIRSFRDLRKKYNYFPPFTAEHPEMVGELIGEPVVDGAIYGLISQLRITPEGGVEAKVKLNDLGKRLADSGALTYVSPSFFTEWRDPHGGNLLGPVLREVSAVTVPHQKNLKTDLRSVYRLSETDQLNSKGFARESVKMEEEMTTEEEVGMEEGQTTEEPEETALAELSPEMEARIVELVAQAVAAAMAGSVEDVAEDVSMSERVEALEGQLRAERNLNAVREAHPAIDKDLAQDLAAVRMSDEARYKRLSKLVSVNMSETKTKGSVGTKPATTYSADRVVSLAEDAAKSGVKRGKDLVRFMRAKGVDDAAINESLQSEATRKRITDVYSVYSK